MLDVEFDRVTKERDESLAERNAWREKYDAAVLFLGVFGICAMLFGAYWYQTAQKERRLRAIETRKAIFPETNSQDFDIYATSQKGKYIVFKCHVEYRIDGYTVRREYRRLDELELNVKTRIGWVIKNLFMFESWDDFDKHTFEQKTKLLIRAPLSRIVTIADFRLTAEEKE